MREEAAQALEELFQAAENSGYTLVAQSGYRSVERQASIYNNNIATKGQEWTDQYSAAPGHSEHNTGLAMDITIPLEAGGFLGLEEALGDTEPGQWVAENAHKYGFVIRYPEGKSDITGYNYEPWHLRYFGKELATKFTNLV
ncbi:M15 family metallopeptidase [Piscibacillus salipiscarius]|uniref:M15 family metallopeptidase n=1 Tax=Piscibacillus salipiscarius TaxID=299480 RepID=UPI0006CF4968|nr:M15 family metallopeptidase [Piscibacillus salipiscarius]